MEERKGLPDSFLNRIRTQLGDEFDDYMKSFEQKGFHGLRTNSLKLTPEEFLSISPVSTRRVPWVRNGFYYMGDQPSHHPYYYAGLYYIQEPSAMTPASILPVEPGDRVLDLCAAPGGKSTELASRLQGKGVLVSNDISNSRAKALLKNLELFGVENALIISEAPNKLADYFEGYFDKILVDAPCSGEGMFRRSPTIIKNWEQYGTEYYNKLQKEILPQAVRMLRPGGMLLYSTCTFSPMENEGTIQFLLDEYPDLSLVSVPKADGVDYTGFASGNPDFVENGSEELRKTIRLWPHKIDGEGHFIALLQKSNTDSDDKTDMISLHKTSQNNSVSLSDETEQFLAGIKRDFPRNRIRMQDNRLYFLPDCSINTKGLRVLRSGLLLGEEKTKRFEPSQALACNLRAFEYERCYNLSADDPDVTRYLKCESIEIKQNFSDGWLLICVDGYPLGWGKYVKGQFKNRYLPGWRLM